MTLPLFNKLYNRVTGSLFVKLWLSLLCAISFLIVTVLLIVNWSFKHGLDEYLIAQEDQQLGNLTANLATYYQQHNSWDGLINNHELLAKLASESGIRPPPLRPSTTTDGHNPPPHPPSVKGAPPPSLMHRLSVYNNNKDVLIGPPDGLASPHSKSIMVQGEQVGYINWQPIQPINDELASSFLNQQAKNLIWIALGSILISLLVALLWARIILNPITRLMQGTQALIEGDFNNKIGIHGHDELNQLACDFNLLAITLERNQVLRTAWLADISHELRTPISVINGTVEAMLDGLYPADEEHLQALHQDIQMLTKLVNDLYQLALADQEQFSTNFAMMDLRQTIKDMSTLYQPRLKSAGLQLHADLPTNGPVLIMADKSRIQQLLGNLLENSLRYTDAPGTVDITLHTKANQAYIRITDSAPGVPMNSIGRIFDRLYRVDKSRSRAHGGSGLGLSLCQSIVKAHHGKIAASNAPSGGLQIDIEIPLTQ